MAASAQCSGVTRDGDKFLVNFTDSVQREYASLAHMYNSTVGDPSIGAGELDLARNYLIANWLRTDPSGSNPSGKIVGWACTVDMSSGFPLSITKVA